MKANITGKRFGRWTVLGMCPERRRHIGGAHIVWRCRCDCGVERNVRGSALRFGKSRSCGCVSPTFKHGHARKGSTTRAYRCWRGMLDRCNRPRNKAYPHYGGRGISVCARWFIFENFLADMGEPLPDKSIDRIDPNGNYEPGNCRWATYAEQVTNRRPFTQIGLRGDRTHFAKLSAPEIAQIRALKGVQSQSQIARQFGISRSNVSLIQTGKTWGAS